MTPLQIQLATALHRCSHLPGSYPKRFARDLHAKAHQPNPPDLTLNQQRYLYDQVIRFRRQISSQQPNGPALVQQAREQLAIVTAKIQEQEQKDAAAIQKKAGRR